VLVPATFTVIIPTHNRCETVLLAARSALAQTRAPEQVIVICDGCTDGSAERLRELGDERVEVLEVPKAHGYGYGHRNTAVAMARGSVVSWLADDDLFLPDHLERAAEYWDAGNADLVTAPAVWVREDDTLVHVGNDLGVEAARIALRTTCETIMGTVTVRAGLIEQVGGWDGELPRGGDWTLWLRCVEHPGVAVWATLEPTVLHFRATGRVQAWEDRVRQNTAWWERISDPAGLVHVRRALRRT
jgi:glycosyltransferase involved in cell wall biosynthesis